MSNWCVHCQTYFDAAACPDCGDGGTFSPTIADGFAVNAGAWQLKGIIEHITFGACHTPGFDPLIMRFQAAQQAVAEDESRIRRLPRPWLGDPHHNRLKRERDTARAKCIAYILAHKDILIIGGR